MPPPPTVFEKLALALVVLLALIALAFTVLTPGYSLDLGVVYQGF